MSLLDDVDLDGVPDPEAPPPVRPSWAGPVLSLLIFAGLLAGFWAYRLQKAPSNPPPLAGPVATPRVPPATLAQGAPVVTLPALPDFDPFVRDAIRSLTRAAAVLAWLSTDHLAEQFVAIVQGTSEGGAPMRLLGRFRPTARFRVLAQGGRTVIDPASYQRYDGIADAVTSFDPAASARVYGTLKPRLQEAYATLGILDSTLDTAVEGALVRLLSTPVTNAPMEVTPRGGVYAFANPTLEALSPAQKLLLRTGPANARRIQARMRDIALALGIPASRLRPVT